MIGATVEIWVCVIIDRRFLNYTQFSFLYFVSTFVCLSETEAFFVTWCRLFAYFDVRSLNSNYLNVKLIWYLRNWFIIKCHIDWTLSIIWIGFWGVEMTSKEVVTGFSQEIICNGFLKFEFSETVSFNGFSRLKFE